MSSGGQTPVTTTQQETPWAGAQPGLSAAIGGAQNLYAGDVGYQPWPSSTMAGLNPALEFGLGGMYTRAANEYGGPATINAGLGLAQNMIQNQGLTEGQRNFVAPGYQNVYNEASSQQNPYLLSQLAAQDRRISDKVNSSMSGAGRYGSGAHTDVLGRSLAEASYPVLAADYAQRQQTRMGALGGLQGLYSGGLDTAGRFAQLAPTLEQAKYAPYDRLMSYGQYYQDRAQKELENQMNLYNATQARPWEQVARLNAISAGQGALGGTKVQSTTQPAIPTTQRIFGGALAGAGLGSMFPGIGTGLGAGAGGLLGLLG